MKAVISQPIPTREVTARPHRLKGWQLDGLVLLLFVALTVAMTWPVVPNMDRSLEQWGDALLQTWTLDWDAHALLSDPLHFASANIFYPYQDSLAFSETLAGQALLVAPIIWLTNNPVLAYNLLLLASFVLCGWGTYLLGKELTGRRVAGLVAGVIFAFFPHRFGQLSHLHLLTAQWMPFALLYLRRYLNGGQRSGVRGQELGTRGQGSGVRGQELGTRGQELDATGQADQSKIENRLSPNGGKSKIVSLVLFAFFFLLELLSSTYLGLFLVVAVGLYLVYRLVDWLWQGRKAGRLLWRWRGNKGLGLGVALVVVGLVALPFYWPYLSVQQDLGFQRSASEVQSFSALPYYYLDVPRQNRLNQLIYQPLFKQDWWQSSAGGERGLWLGLIALLLGGLGALVATTGRKRKPDGLFYLILLILAVSFTFGPAWQTGRFGAIPLPYALLYNFVPGYAAIRVPVRFIYVVALALAALAAFGVAWLQERRWLAGKWRTAALGVVLVGLLCGEYATNVDWQTSNILRGTPPAEAQWLDAHPAPTLHVPLSGSDSTDLFIQYWARGSWRPVMNGFSGFMPPSYNALKADVASEGFSPRILQLLQGLEVRYLEIQTDDDTVKPQWAKLKADLEKFGATEAAHFGGVAIYELPADPWLTRLHDLGMGPDSQVYFVEYRRAAQPLLELTASYLERTGTLRQENLYGTISVGFRNLPPLPAGRPADFLVLPPGEDPTLYGFQASDKVFANQLLAVYKRNPNLLARYDFTRQEQSGMLNRSQPLNILPDGNSLKFEGKPGSASPAPSRVLTLGLAVLQPQKLTLTRPDGSTDMLDLKPGLSTCRLPFSAGLTISGGTFSLAWVELWQGQPSGPVTPELRSNVVLLSATTSQDKETGVADVQIVGPQPGTNYTATLDVYNTPWGAHPYGHYGYWSLPVPGGSVAQTRWQLDLAHKVMTTNLNGGNVPNYPPDPAQFDITRYGNLGDFRANLNLYAGDKLLGSTRLFDFTVWAQGDKNRPENRHASAFKGYNTALAFLVI